MTLRASWVVFQPHPATPSHSQHSGPVNIEETEHGESLDFGVGV